MGETFTGRAFTCQRCGKHEANRWTEGMAAQMHERQLCFHCNFWHTKAQKKDRPDFVRVDGTHYMIGDEGDPEVLMRGFGGARFIVRFTAGPRAGEVVTTTNLWCQGIIPDEWRDELPDNAVFLKRLGTVPTK